MTENSTELRHLVALYTLADETARENLVHSSPEMRLIGAVISLREERSGWGWKSRKRVDKILDKIQKAAISCASNDYSPNTYGEEE